MKNTHVMTGFAVLMLIYSGWRAFDYINGNLAGVSDAIRLLISFAFLAFSEIGLLVWLHVARPNATTDTQETTATALIWADFVGSMVVGLGDMAKHNTLYRVDLSAIDPLLFLAPWVMVVLNVGGYLVYHMHDSEAQLEQAERQLHHEETRLEMAARRAAIRELQQNKEQVAQELAPHYYRDIRNRVTGRTFKRFTKAADNLDTGTQAATPPQAARDELPTEIIERLNGMTHPNGRSR